MNRKGYITSFIFGLIGLFVLILVLVSLMPFTYNSDYDLNKSLNVLDTTQKNLSITFSQRAETSYSNQATEVLMKVIFGFVNWIVNAAFEVTKLAVKIGYDNPEIVNPKVLLWIIILSLLAPIAVALFKILIIIGLLTKEYFQSRKEKKRFGR